MFPLGNDSISYYIYFILHDFGLRSRQNGHRQFRQSTTNNFGGEYNLDNNEYIYDKHDNDNYYGGDNFDDRDNGSDNEPDDCYCN